MTQNLRALLIAKDNLIQSGGSRCDKLFPGELLVILGPSLTAPDIKDIEARFKELGSAIRAAAPTMRELTDAIQALREKARLYSPPLCPRPRPRRRRFRAKHNPTRLQRRRNRQTKQKHRK